LISFLKRFFFNDFDSIVLVLLYEDSHLMFV
jgi:hypothetical protein